MEQFINVEFTSYVALAVVIFAIREAVNISNKYIPLVALVLGILFAWSELKGFSFNTVLEGIKYGLYAVGSVAGIKYAVESVKGTEVKEEVKAEPVDKVAALADQPLDPDDVIDINK